MNPDSRKHRSWPGVLESQTAEKSVQVEKQDMFRELPAVRLEGGEGQRGRQDPDHEGL